MTLSSTIPTPTGRERRRLTPRFRVRTVQVQDGLFELIADRFDHTDDARFRVGQLLWRHSAGIWGPVADRSLNDFVLQCPYPLDCDRWVVSRHVVVDDISIEIATNLTRGITLVRRASTRGTNNN